MIGILNYGVGNVRAFEYVYEHLNIPYKSVSTINDFKKVTHIILPGVGAFDYAMISLNKSGLRGELDRLVQNEKTPVLGVCVGMQMMGVSSEEGHQKGLGWLDASCKKITNNNAEDLGRLPLPHMGWNTIHMDRESSLLNGIDDQARFYFLHSYFLHCKDKNSVVAEVKYGSTLTSIVQYDNICGIQQHPEKSHSSGVKFLENFWSI